ncbi:MAG: ROK family protein [Blautia sp.]|nr:ROK family protein [Blautia sp.]MDY3997728.1 ROK family protein [Blautia sp.]
MERGCVGIDIGGTSVKLGMFDEEGTLLEKWSIPTNRNQNGAEIIPDIAASVSRKLNQLEVNPAHLTGIGVGVPGQVSEDGMVLLAENLGWKNVPLMRELSERTGLPVCAENDANLAALGESWKGSAGHCHSMMFVTLGTGIGCGIVVKGQILTGVHGAAGEIGHMHAEDHMPEQCVCGKYGCLEQLASATGLRWMGERALERSTKPSLLREGEVSAKTIFEAAGKGDVLAVRVAEQFGKYLGKALADCTCVLNPEVIVIGGGVAKGGQIVLDYIEKYYRQYAYQPFGETKLKLASLGNDAGIYGAARLAITSESLIKQVQ